MDRTITTIYYNGQFWVALTERFTAFGNYQIGRYVFGTEPDHNDLLHFYLNVYDSLKFHNTSRPVKVPKIKKHTDSVNRISKSHDIFKELQKQALHEKKVLRKKQVQREQDLAYRLKKKRKKEKRRGH